MLFLLIHNELVEKDIKNLLQLNKFFLENKHNVTYFLELKSKRNQQSNNNNSKSFSV